MKQIASFQEVNTAFVNRSFATKTDAELKSYLTVFSQGAQLQSEPSTSCDH